MMRKLLWQEQDADRDPVIWIDVAKVDADWRLDPEQYVRPGGHLQSNSPYRWKRAARRFATGLPHFMPLILIQDGQMTIEDGRHRFACARDHGATAIPVQALSDIDEIRLRYGTTERISAVRMPGAMPVMWRVSAMLGMRIGQ